jgi:glutathione S-transferase
MSVPILYSLQHCPFAMRARMGILMARQEVLLRAVVTKDKPREMLAISPKGTVPILIFEDGTVIDESLDIMIWALKKNDPEDLLYKAQPELFSQIMSLIDTGDTEFRKDLSLYKHGSRYHQPEENELRSKCELFIKQLESRLEVNSFLFGNKLSIADLAVLPNVRQFINVDRKWFRQTDYPHLKKWLETLLQSLLFTKAMRKYELWNESNKEFVFSWKQSN